MLKKDAPPKFTMENVTLAKAYPFLSVTITPDAYLITGTNEQKCIHKIKNHSPFPIVVKIKLSSGVVRSHRIDFCMLPCIASLNPIWEMNPSLAFNTPYKPIVKSIRYKAPRPWTTVVDDLIHSTHEISMNITNCCMDAKIFHSRKNSITLNEFAILDEAFGQSLEKEPVRSVIR